MAVNPISLLAGSKKITSIPVTAGTALVVMIVVVKLLGMEPWDAAKLAMFLCSGGPIYGVVEGVRDARGNSKPEK